MAYAVLKCACGASLSLTVPDRHALNLYEQIRAWQAIHGHHGDSTGEEEE